ncbi:MAG TPA: 4Fe-4S dicluster domain-containing protein [Thermoplasmata archaeon]|nr:4Fe-4S dicluster domain-containing protein [Thermoplasmata archaeon]
MKKKEKVIVFLPERCTGCRYCEVACSYVHHGQADFKKSNIFVIFEEENSEIAVANCQHCSTPFCLVSCPAEAIEKDEETGLVKINPLRCIGCKSCILACPLKVIWFDEERRVAMKCDFCKGDPLCVKYCSPSALRVVERDELEEYLRKECIEEEGAEAR